MIINRNIFLPAVCVNIYKYLQICRVCLNIKSFLKSLLSAHVGEAISALEASF